MNKYSTNITEIKKRLKSLRKNPDGSTKYTQAEVAEAIHIGNGDKGRTSITNWENIKNQTLPSLYSLIELCNFYDTDMDYILGKTNIRSEDTHTISQCLHLSTTTVDTLKNHPAYGVFLDYIVNDDLFSKITTRSKQLSQNQLLRDVVTTSFAQAFEKKLYGIFNDFYSSIFPMDISATEYKKYLSQRIPNDDNFEAHDFINANFLEDGQNYIFNAAENFDEIDPDEQYQLIMNAIVEISYDYYMSTYMMQLSEQNLVQTLAQIVDTAISGQTEQLRARIKKNTARLSPDPRTP